MVADFYFAAGELPARGIAMTPTPLSKDETIDIISRRIDRLYIEELRSCVREFYHPNSIKAEIKRSSYNYQPQKTFIRKGIHL